MTTGLAFLLGCVQRASNVRADSNASELQGASDTLRFAVPLLLFGCMVTLFGSMLILLNGFAFGNHLPGAGPSTWLLAAAVALLSHELGHVAAAKAVGLRINLVGARLGVAGIVRPTPVSLENLRSGWLTTAAGGPAASLLLAIVSLLALLRTPGSDFVRFGYAFGACGLLSSLVLFRSLLPIRGLFFVSDGLVMLTLLRDGAEADHLCAGARLAATGRRPRDWDEAWMLAIIAAGRSARDRCSGHLTAYAHALDAGRLEEAGRRLDRAIEYMQELSPRSDVLFESAYFEARHRGNAGKAREYLNRTTGLWPRLDAYAIPRCEAAVLISEGRYDDAELALGQAESALSRTRQSGDTLAEWDLVRDLEEQLDLRRKQGSNESR